MMKRDTQLLLIILLTSIIVQEGQSLWGLSNPYWLFLWLLILIILALKNLTLWRSIKLSWFSRSTKTKSSEPKWQNRTWLILLLAVVIVGLGLRVYSLGQDNFQGDEFQVMGSAYGYYQTGQFCCWDWTQESCGDTLYLRAWPHTWLVAQSFQIFGFSEWSARLPSAIFGTLLICLAYFLASHATKDRRVGLLLSMVVAFNPFLIELSRYTRMYILFIPIFLAGSYLFYLGLNRRSPWSFKDNSIWQRFFNLFNFDFRFLLAGLFLLYLSYLLQVVTLLAGVGIFLFIVSQAFYTKEKRYRHLLLVMVSILGLLAILKLAGVDFFKSHFIVWRSQFHWRYFSILFSYPFSALLTGTIILVNLPSLIKKESTRYFLILSLVALIFFIFFSNRYISPVYISNYLPIAWFFVSCSLVWAYDQIVTKDIRGERGIRGEKKWFLVVFLILVCFSLSLAGQQRAFFGKEKNMVEYKKAYQQIEREAQNGDLLLGQYLRVNYLRDRQKFKIISLLSGRRYSFVDFIEQISKNSRIWVVWQSGKSYHLRPKIKEFVQRHFQKIYGEETNYADTEIYFLEKSSY
jgi:hypothetical protein